MAERRQDKGGWLLQEDLEKAQEAIRILSAIPLANAGAMYNYSYTIKNVQ